MGKFFYEDRCGNVYARAWWVMLTVAGIILLTGFLDNPPT